MSKNEYRRAFIMLRPALPGYSGHVRLERRTMTGSMYFIVTAPFQSGTLSAALAGQRGGSYYAAPLGALRPDSRGQYTLAWSFDPRNIDGRPLEAYQLLTVARTDADSCQLALTGNVDGAYPMDTTAVREAVCALFQAEIPADDLPGSDMSASDVSGSDVSASDASAPDADPIFNGDAAEAAALQAPPSDALPVNADISDSDIAEQLSQAAEPSANSESPQSGARIFTRMRVPESASGGTTAEAPSDSGSTVTLPSPAELTGAASQPQQTAPLSWRTLFGMDQATPCAMPLEDGYTYVRVPLPASCGYGYCMIGVRVDDDRVESVRVALPGDYAATPPDGLEGSVWLSAGNNGASGNGGNAAGYWVYTLRCRNRDFDFD